jgi:hypothetical protein
VGDPFSTHIVAQQRDQSYSKENVGSLLQANGKDLTYDKVCRIHGVVVSNKAALFGIEEGEQGNTRLRTVWVDLSRSPLRVTREEDGLLVRTLKEF